VSVHWQLGKIRNGIVAVTAYGVVDSIAIPLLFGLQTIADLATYRSKRSIAAGIMRELKAIGFQFKERAG